MRFLLIALVSLVAFPAASHALCPRLDNDVSPWVKVIHGDADAPGSGRIEYALMIYPKAELDQPFSQRFEFTPLAYAARVHGDVSAIAALLAATPTPQKSDSFLRTALHQAALCGNLAAVELFIKNGFEVDAIDGFGATPFIYALQSGEERTALALLDAGASITVTPKDKSALVAVAARTGKAQVLARLLVAGQSANGVDYRGNSALYYAAERSDVLSVIGLLEAGAKLDAKSPETGLTPLEVTRNFETLLALVAAGAKSTSAKDTFALTCYTTFAQGFDESTDPMCSGNAASGYRLFKHLTPEVISELVKAGVIVLAEPFETRTSKLAIDPVSNYFDARFLQTDHDEEDEQVLRLVLEAGYPVNANQVLWDYFNARAAGTVDSGALKLAQKLGVITNETLASRCLAKDCAVDTSFGEFSVPLFYYTAQGNQELINELIEAGADPKQVVTTVDGPVGLADYALMQGQHDLFQDYAFNRKLPIKNAALMADFGDEFFKATEIMFFGDIRECLHTGAQIQRLIALGAQVNAAGKDGKLALSEALARRDFCSAQKLVAMGADVKKASIALGEDPSALVFNHILLRDADMAQKKSEMTHHFAAAGYTMNQFFAGTGCSPEFVAEIEPALALIEDALAWPRGNRNLIKSLLSKKYRKDKWQYLWKYRFVNYYRERCLVK